jgi:hypothetical protein
MVAFPQFRGGQGRGRTGSSGLGGTSASRLGVLCGTAPQGNGTRMAGRDKATPPRSPAIPSRSSAQTQLTTRNRVFERNRLRVLVSRASGKATGPRGANWRNRLAGSRRPAGNPDSVCQAPSGMLLKTRRRLAANAGSSSVAVVCRTSRSIDQWPWTIRFRGRIGCCQGSRIPGVRRSPTGHRQRPGIPRRPLHRRQSTWSQVKPGTASGHPRHQHQVLSGP